jgi:pimeloyl-ACP methyl ester carboxylesterase
MNNIILLHGALGAKIELLPLANLLNEHYKVHVLEFEGHGETPLRNVFSIPNFSENLKRFIEENQIQGADIFAYSMGGYVALYLASINTELLGKIITLGTKFHWTPEAASQEVRMLNPDKIEEKVPKFAAYLSRLHGENEWKTQMNRTAQLMLALGENELLHDRFSIVRNTCYLLLGDADEMVSKKETQKAASLIPNATLQILEDTVHPIARVNMEVLAKRIKTIL